MAKKIKVQQDNRKMLSKVATLKINASIDGSPFIVINNGFRYDFRITRN